MTSEVDKQWLKSITMEAMNRLEELKLEPESSLDLSLDNITATPEEAPQEESQPTPAKGAPPKRRQPSRGNPLSENIHSMHLCYIIYVNIMKNSISIRGLHSVIHSLAFY